MEKLATYIVREGALPARDAVGWVVRLAATLEPIHGLNVAHGRVSAKAIQIGSASCTSQGFLLDAGDLADDPSYHSLDRATGGVRSPQNDTWAAGVILYQCLTGSLPFAGITAEEVSERILGPPPSPLAVFDVGDDDLQAVLDQLFAADPDERLRSLTRLRDQLVAWDPSVADVEPLSYGRPEEARRARGQDIDDEDSEGAFDTTSVLPRDMFMKAREEILVRREQRERQQNAPPSGPGLHKPVVDAAALFEHQPASQPVPPPRLPPPPAARPKPAPLPPPARREPLPPPARREPLAPPPAAVAPPPAAVAPPPVALPASQPRVQASDARSAAAGSSAAGSSAAGLSAAERSSLDQLFADIPSPLPQPPARPAEPEKLLTPSTVPARGTASPKKSSNAGLWALFALLCAGAAGYYWFELRPKGVSLFGDSSPKPTATVASALPVASTTPPPTSEVAANPSSVPASSVPASSGPPSSGPPSSGSASSAEPAASGASTAEPTAAPPGELMACMTPLFPEDTFVGRQASLGFVCDETNPYKGASELHAQVVRSGRGDKGVTDGMKEWATLGWYSMAVFAIVRHHCCPNAKAFQTPTTLKSCHLDESLTTLGAAAFDKQDDPGEAAIGDYNKAIYCLGRGGAAHMFGQVGYPKGGELTTFKKYYKRARKLRQR